MKSWTLNTGQPKNSLFHCLRLVRKVFPKWLSGKESIRLPMRETQVQSLGWEDFLGKEMATHSSILAWKISWAEEPGRLQFMGSQRGRRD